MYIVFILLRGRKIKLNHRKLMPMYIYTHTYIYNSENIMVLLSFLLSFLPPSLSNLSFSLSVFFLHWKWSGCYDTDIFLTEGINTHIIEHKVLPKFILSSRPFCYVEAWYVFLLEDETKRHSLRSRSSTFTRQQI